MITAGIAAETPQARTARLETGWQARRETPHTDDFVDSRMKIIRHTGGCFQKNIVSLQGITAACRLGADRSPTPPQAHDG